MAGLMLVLSLLAAEGVSLGKGDAAPAALELATLDGHRQTLDFEGQITVVDFFATWCPHCRESVAVHEELVAAYGDRVRIVVIDVQEPVLVARRYFARRPLPPGVELLVDPFNAAMQGFAPRQFPSFYVIDPAGNIRYVQTGWGEGSARALGAQVGRLLKQKPRARPRAALGRASADGRAHAMGVEVLR